MTVHGAALLEHHGGRADVAAYRTRLLDFHAAVDDQIPENFAADHDFTCLDVPHDDGA